MCATVPSLYDSENNGSRAVLMLAMCSINQTISPALCVICLVSKINNAKQSTFYYIFLDLDHSIEKIPMIFEVNSCFSLLLVKSKAGSWEYNLVGKVLVMHARTSEFRFPESI